MKNIKKIIVNTILGASLLLPFAAALPVSASVLPNWNATGNYVIDQNYNGSDNSVNVTLSQDNSGNLTGSGTSGAYTWTIASGSVSANNLTFTANYTATADAVTPLTVMTVNATIAQDGTMSGTWSDNYKAGVRTGAWTTTSGAAVVNQIMTQAATNVSSTDATLNGMNGGMDATQSSFWVSAAPFVTTSTTLPTGVFSTPELGAVTAGTVLTSTLSSAVGLPAITANTTYYFAAWSEVDGTWNPGAVMSLTTLATGSIGTGNIGGNVIPGVGTLHVDSVTMTKTTSTADGTFAGGWEYVFNITVPTNEPKLSMNFSNWTSGANTIPVAGNMRISSAQADNADATILLTGANIYSTPVLNMTTDLDPATPGRQVQITVEVAVPVGTVAGAYSANYGVQTNP